MIKISQLKLRPDHSAQDLESALRRLLQIGPDEKMNYSILRQSVDARKKPDIYYVYTVSVSLSSKNKESQLLRRKKASGITAGDEPVYRWPPEGFSIKKAAGQAGLRPVIVGSGPAGLFCALLLARAGLCPLILERGECVEKRAETVERFWRGNILDPESNVQFGEGGAGTFSDGKLNTGVKDSAGRIRFILDRFVKGGADPSVLYSYKPHVGTDSLRSVVKDIRNEIISLGGSFLFNHCLTGIRPENPSGSGQKAYWKLSVRKRMADNSFESFEMSTDKLVLAIGHSARDTFGLLMRQGFVMSAKAFAVGVRIQHPQKDIDMALYGENPYSMPPAPYKLTHRLKDGRGVYSFCMCPGGYVVNASSEKGMLAVNGMSFHDRGGEYANSAIVVTVSPEDYIPYCEKEREHAGSINAGGLLIEDSLRSGSSDYKTGGGIAFQRLLESRSYRAGGGRIPVQLFRDFCKGQVSREEGAISGSFCGAYEMSNLWQIFPSFVSESIKEGIMAFDRQISGFARYDALLAAAESRTSSPVRIERDTISLQAVNMPGIYPCGEGAGYAGGISSAAADGMKVAEAIVREMI